MNIQLKTTTMKTKITLLLLFTFALTSCTKWHYGHGHDDDDGGSDIIYNDSKVEEGGPINQGPRLIPSPDKLIVNLDPNMSEPRLLELLALLEIKDTTGCSCGDTNIKQWTVDTDLLEIETARRRLQDESSGRGDLEGDRGFDIRLDTIFDFNPVSGQFNTDGLAASGNAGTVNIAVLDTGIDFARDLTPTTSRPYLFASNDFSSCFDTADGWNFIDNNNQIQDYHGHGTYVTQIIRNILENSEVDIDYRILPLKVFNREGLGSYWNIVCAMGYIRDINQNGGNISLVNASFGGADAEEVLMGQTVLRDIIEDLNDQTLVVASAGNKGVNTDDGITGHFVSSYPSDNLLAVGGYDFPEGSDNDDEIFVHERSNFGLESIDVALEFENYSVELDTFDDMVKDRAGLEGTSYGAAAMTGLAAEIYVRSGRPNTQRLKARIFRLSVPRDGLNGKIGGSRAIIRERISF